MHTPDHDHYVIEFSELVNVVLGTLETLPAWVMAINHWETERPAEQRGMPSVTARVSELAELRARSFVRSALVTSATPETSCAGSPTSLTSSTMRPVTMRRQARILQTWPNPSQTPTRP